MKKLPSLVSISLTALALGGTYAWACYYTGTCTCAVAGSCYAKAVLPTCQIPTCIIADAAAVTWNVCEGNGSYQGRERIYPNSACCPSVCRVYDNCTQQYVSFTGASCCFETAHYQATGSDCR